MTKEEFNKKWPMSKIPDAIRGVSVAWGDAHNWFIEDKVKLAQDILEATDKHVSEYSKQQSIGFAEFLFKGGYHVHSFSEEWMWVKRSLSVKEVSTLLTTRQLYDEFLSEPLTTSKCS